MTAAVAVNSGADTAAATLFQRNKHIYINEENTLETLASDATFLQTFQSWLDASVSQLDGQFERCEQQLAELQQSVAVHGGQYWCGKTIIEHCNLHMAEKRLVKKNAVLEDNYASLPDLINLITCLQQIKGHSFMSVKQRRFIEECEEQLHKVLFEPRDLLFIINALKTKLKDDGNTRGVFGDLTSFQNTIEDLSPDIEECEQLLEASIVNGEMKLAEDISKRQLDVYEHILRLITDQYPVIANYYADSRDSDRRRRWAIFRMVDKDITTVIDCKHRQVEACEEDLHKINTQISNYTEDDTQQRKRYEADRTESDTFLQQNKDKQHGVWNRIYALYQELQGCASDLAQLAHERRQEIDRRLHVEEREAGRRSGFNAFLQAAASHAQMLQDTIDNALSAKDIAEALNEFVLDGCENIAQKYDKQQNALSEMLQLVQQHHFRRFSDYYIAASRFLYRKERKLNQLEETISTNAMKQEMMSESLNPRAKEFAMENEQLALRRHEVQQEVMYLRHKLEKAESAIAPTLRSLQFAGIEYVHPKEIVKEMNLNRWSTMLDYRALVNPSIPPLARIRAEEQATLARLKATLEQDSGFSLSEGANATMSSSRRRFNKLAIPLKEYQERTSAQSMFTTHVQSVLDQQQRKLSEYKTNSINTNNNNYNNNNGNRYDDQNGMNSRNNEPVTSDESPTHTLHSERLLGQRPHETELETKNVKGKEAVKPMSTMPPGTANMADYFKESSGLTLPKIAATQVVFKARKDDKGKITGGNVINSDGNGNSLPVMTYATGHNLLAAKPSDLDYAQRARRVLPRQMEGAVFAVLYPYKARAPDELNLEENDRVVCISRTAEEGWFKGVCNQRTGLFPINYVEPVECTDKCDELFTTKESNYTNAYNVSK